MTPVVTVFLLTVFGVFAFFVWVEWKTERSTFFADELGFGLWIFGSGALALSGLLGRFDWFPPPFLLWIATGLGLTLLLALGWFGGSIAEKLGWGPLIGFQVFRVPVEWVLVELGRAGIAPPQMTLDGTNFDVVTGVTAPVVAWLAATGRIGWRALALWNVMGLALLANVVITAMLSAPTPLRVFTNEPALTFVATVPWFLLPGFLVPAALFGHVVPFRKLRLMR